MRIPGKKVGTKVYVHKDYTDLAMPGVKLIPAEKAAAAMHFDYTIVRYDKSTGEIALLECPDFDYDNEPSVGRSLLIREGQAPKLVNATGTDPWIYHHKWSMVGDDYDGFDIERAKARSAAYEGRVTPEISRRMGKRSYWDKQLKTWKLPQ